MHARVILPWQFTLCLCHECRADRANLFAENIQVHPIQQEVHFKRCLTKPFWVTKRESFSIETLWLLLRKVWYCTSTEGDMKNNWLIGHVGGWVVEGGWSMLWVVACHVSPCKIRFMYAQVPWNDTSCPTILCINEYIFSSFSYFLGKTADFSPR